MRSNDKDQHRVTNNYRLSTSQGRFFPSGNRIAFIGQNSNSSYGATIYSAKADGSGQRQIVKLSNKGVYNIADFDISPDGKKIVLPASTPLVLASSASRVRSTL